MSLSQALSAAMSGLRATQVGLSTVAANVANAETPGYVRKTPTQVTTAAGEFNVNVRVAGIQRELDLYVQRQLRIETSGGSYAGVAPHVSTVPPQARPAPKAASSTREPGRRRPSAWA